jgi:hypothetical protein
MIGDGSMDGVPEMIVGRGRRWLRELLRACRVVELRVEGGRTSLRVFEMVVRDRQGAQEKTSQGLKGGLTVNTFQMFWKSAGISLEHPPLLSSRATATAISSFEVVKGDVKSVLSWLLNSTLTNFLTSAQIPSVYLVPRISRDSPGIYK